MAKLKHQIHLISLTHWDREWRFPFEETRMLLVEMMDGLLDLLDRSAGYRHYHLDGQSILLEDYLQVRPDRRERLVREAHRNREVGSARMGRMSRLMFGRGPPCFCSGPHPSTITHPWVEDTAKMEAAL